MKIKVGHLSYDVRGLSPFLADSESALGVHIPDDSAIYVRTDQPPAEQVRILLHELVHAMWHAHNLPAGAISEETICGALESPLAALVRDNPTLWAKLAAAFDGKPLVKNSRSRR